MSIQRVETANSKLTTAQLRGLLQQLVKRKGSMVSSNEHDKNPQVVAMVAKARAELELAESILRALNGDMVDLKLYL